MLKTIVVEHRGAALINAGVLGLGSGLAQFLKVLCDINFVHWLFKLCDEISLVLGIFAWLGLLFMPVLIPCGGVVLEAGGNLGIKKPTSS